MDIIEPNEDYFSRYTALVKESSLNKAFKKQDKVLRSFMKSISEKKANHAYAEGKWTLKEVLQHLIDCERIFSYRALAIARGEKLNLPGFEENDYAANSNANSRSWKELCKEMEALRESTKLLFKSFTDEMLDTEGSFSNTKGKAGRLGFIIIGHTYHHINVVKERYL